MLKLNCHPARSWQTLTSWILHPCSGGKYTLRFPWASGPNNANSQSTHNLVLCVFLSQDTLSDAYSWLISLELTAHSVITHAPMKLTWHTCFLHKALFLLSLGRQTALQPKALKLPRKRTRCGTEHTVRRKWTQSSLLSHMSWLLNTTMNSHSASYTHHEANC